ncbi:unnamed protein product [Phyllotreta striolata]|uniref:SWIM-type domain-containing protein n=1 Tax=Phyllotreta striolata TaxID=444603 RepID=A0A9N9XU82_PHYSR|nr:unnamed protein product [Phyllotreta striolata]
MSFVYYFCFIYKYLENKKMLMSAREQLYSSLLKANQSFHEYPLEKITSNLGKSTKRGIKKCTKCGVYNGTRSAICKNKRCGRILKCFEEKSKTDSEAVQLISNTKKQVYSVKIRNTGQDSRGFVQLPLMHSSSDEDSSVYPQVALCFVDSCQNSFDNSILKCHEETANISDTLCVHIKSALNSQIKATPLPLNRDLLEFLQYDQSVKDKLKSYDVEKDGPLVQKVSQSVLVVKCKVSAKHPFGYLHFTFDKGKGEDSYDCSCTEFSEVSNKVSKCFHYYACLWAIMSEQKHNEGVSCFLKRHLPTERSSSALCESTSLGINSSLFKKSPSKCQKKVIKKAKLITSRRNGSKCRKIMPKVLPIEIKVLENDDRTRNEVSWDFIDWLSFVTESINSTMRFENFGIINTIVLQIPELFFRNLIKRIPIIYEPMRSGNTTTYYVMNILHLKEIFDTPKVKLKISKKFVYDDRTGYVEFDDTGEMLEDSAHRSPFIYFFNVGQSTVDESDNTNNSFDFEWTTPAFSVLNVGQLRLQYKFGRKST